MNLDTIATKLRTMAAEIKAEKGPLSFLGLFLRDESWGLWDLVVSAAWMRDGERASFEYVAQHLRTSLSAEELASISRVVILENGGAVHNAFLTQFRGQTGLADVHYVAEGGVVIRRAFILLAHDSPQNPQRAKSRTTKSPRAKGQKKPPKQGKSPPSEKATA